MISSIDHLNSITLIGHTDGSLIMKKGKDNINKKISDAPLTSIKILNESTFICGDFNGDLNLINITNDSLKKIITCNDSIIDISINKKYIFVLTSDSLKVINRNNFNIERNLKITNCLNISCNETNLVISCNSNVLLYDIELNLIKEFNGNYGIISPENIFNIFCLIISEKNCLKIYQKKNDEFISFKKELSEDILKVYISSVGFYLIVEFESGIKGFVLKDNEICEVDLK